MSSEAITRSLTARMVSASDGNRLRPRQGASESHGISEGIEPTVMFQACSRPMACAARLLDVVQGSLLVPQSQIDLGSGNWEEMMLSFQLRKESNSSLAISGHSIKIGDLQERTRLWPVIDSPFATQMSAGLIVFANRRGCP